MQPLFSYVAWVRRSADPRAGRMADRLGERLSGWSKALDQDLVKVWARRSPLSALDVCALSPFGCVLGLELSGGSADSAQDAARGAFVLIEAGPRAGTVRVLRDPTGRIECWRTEQPGCDLLFSHLGDVHDLLTPPPGLNWGYLAHHLNQDYLHGRDTGLEGVSELLPGEALLFTDEGATTRRLWRPERIAQDVWASPAEAQAELRGAAEASVAGWASRYRRVLMDLSGGLDSSIVLGLLRKAVGHPDVVAVTRVTPGSEGDERDYAREAARFNGIELLEQTPRPECPNLEPDFPRRVLRPRARVLPLGYDEAGVRSARFFDAPAFFTGTGGDHLFYNGLPASAFCDHLHHSGLRRALGCAAAIAGVAGDTVWGVGAEALRRVVSGPERLHDIAGVANPYLSRSAREGLDYARYGHPTALAAIDACPPAKRRQIVFMLELQRHYYRYGRADACEEVHPLVSQPLMEAALRTPAPWFAAGGLQRGLARRAFADVVAPRILARRSKGAVGVYWMRFLVDRLPHLRDLMLGGRLAARGVLDRGALDAVLTPMGLSTTRDFMQLSTCISTELWLRQAEMDREDTLARRQSLAASS